MLSRIHIILFLTLIFHSCSFSQKQITAFRTSIPLSIDGLINEEVWNSAIPAEDFLQQEPVPSGNPSFRTSVRILYDDENLYVSFMCYDPEPDKIIAREMKWDGKWSGDDNVSLIFDTFNDDRTGYWFGSNPLGMRDDALMSGIDMGGFREDWNGIWEVRAAIVDSGWSIEFAFPFSTFKFKNAGEQTWGINFAREIRRKGETVQWTSVGYNTSFFRLAEAGDLKGLKDIERGSPVYLKPFLSAGIEKMNGEQEKLVKPGLDIKYGITEQLSLDVSLNTDFSQVEADRAVINLTRFPLSFPEKREFFLEGSQIFNFQVHGSSNLFYSRRIGIYNGEEIPIIGGAKLVGRLNSAEIGIINMQTAEAKGQPSENFSVLRGKFDLLEQSYAGFFFSNRISARGFNRVFAGDAVFTFDDFLGDKTIVLGTGVMKSDETDRKDNSWAAKFYIDYPNDLIDQYLSYRFVQQNFNPGIGFVTRSGIQSILYNFRFNPRLNWKDIHKLNFVPVEAQLDYSGERELLAATFTFQPFGFTTVWGDEFEFEVEREFDLVPESYEVFDSAFVPAGRYWFNAYGVNIETSSGRDVYGAFAAYTGDYYTGRRKYLAGEITVPFSRHFSLSADYEHNTLFFGRNLYTNEFGMRMRYDFSTMANSSVFGQWNNELKLLNLNYRFNWQPKTGSNLYLVVNHLLSTEKALRTRDITLLAKFIWLFTI